MNGMTTQERLDDICRRSGMSKEIVRKVMNAERDSVIESLKHGERAALIGRCVLRPEVRQRLVSENETKKCIKVQASISSTIQTALDELSDSEIDNSDFDSELEAPDGIRLMQITSLI